MVVDGLLGQRDGRSWPASCLGAGHGIHRDDFQGKIVARSILKPVFIHGDGDEAVVVPRRRGLPGLLGLAVAIALGIIEQHGDGAVGEEV